MGGTGRGWNGVSNFRLSDGFLRNSQGEREKAAMYVDVSGRWLRNTDRQDADVAGLFLFFRNDLETQLSAVHQADLCGGHAAEPLF